MNVDLLHWNVTWMLTFSIEMLHECRLPSVKCYLNVDLHWNVTWMLTSFIEMLHECWPPSLKCYMKVNSLHWNVTWMLTSFVEMLHEYWPPALKCYMNVDLHWNATWMLTSFIEMLHEYWPLSVKYYLNVDLLHWNATLIYMGLDTLRQTKVYQVHVIYLSVSAVTSISNYSHCLFKYKKIARYFNVTAHGCLVCQCSQ